MKKYVGSCWLLFVYFLKFIDQSFFCHPMVVSLTFHEFGYK